VHPFGEAADRAAEAGDAQPGRVLEDHGREEPDADYGVQCEAGRGHQEDHGCK